MPKRFRQIWSPISVAYIFSRLYLDPSLSLNAVYALKDQNPVPNQKRFATSTGNDANPQIPVDAGSRFERDQSRTDEATSKLWDALQSDDAIENAGTDEKSSETESLQNGGSAQRSGTKNVRSDVKTSHHEAGSAEKGSRSSEDKGVGEELNSSGRFAIKFVSPTEAYLQSPGWGNGETYPPGLNVSARLEVPRGKVVRVAVQHLNLLHPFPTAISSSHDCSSLRQDTLSAYLVQKSSSTLLWTACRSLRPLPTVRAARAVDFRFITKNTTYDSGVYAAGFRLWLTLFDAGNDEASGSRDGLQERPLPKNWPWPDFTKPQTPPGYCQGEGVTWTGDMCLRVINTEGKYPKKSWTTMQEACREQNASLPSLTTPREWQALVDLMKESGFEEGPRSVTAYVGLRFDGYSPHGYEGIPLYEGLGRWSDDGSVAYFLRDARVREGDRCTALGKGPPWELISVDCSEVHAVQMVCQVHHKDASTLNTAKMATKEAVTPQTDTPSPVQGSEKKSLEGKLSWLVRCPGAGHYMQAYLACDQDCYGSNKSHKTTANVYSVFQDPVPPKGECPVPMDPPPPSFTCDSGTQRVPFTWVCDKHADCGDESDESFCRYHQCEPLQSACADGWQCVESKKQCDGHRDCSDGSDESSEVCHPQNDNTFMLPDLLNTLPPPVLVDTNRHGRLTLKVLADQFVQVNIHDIMAVNKAIAENSHDFFTCSSSTHFRCSLFCLPVYLRCNGVKDCPRGEDEVSCGSYQCPGYYRCHGSTAMDVKVCLHMGNVCDGVYHCPHRDDESLCDWACPKACSCQYGHAFTCGTAFFGKDYPSLRYLHAKDSGMQLGDLNQNRALVYLNLASCEISTVADLTNVLHNLRTLDLSFNKLRHFGANFLTKLPSLRDLSLRSNPLAFPFAAEIQPSLSALQRLDLSMVWILTIDGHALSGLELDNLHILNLSFSGLERVSGKGFQSLGSLQVLDLRGCPMNDFTEDTFSHLAQLKELYGTNPKLCCQGNVHDSVELDVCSTPDNSTTSCDSLLYSNYYRVLLILFAALSLGGNLVSFIYRMFINKDEKSHSCGVMVTHLCVSDFLMGIYLVIIGVADTSYSSTYFIYSDKWRSSSSCKAAGFFSLLSSETSAFFICLLTIDRLAAFRFPNSRLHFRKRSVQLTCWMTWFAGLFMAAIPLIETHWKFYGQTGTCLPLPTNARSFDGRDYSFGVLIMLNFALFLIIAVGQALIHCAMKSKRKTLGVNSEYMSLERAIAKRLIAIAITDFLCWFPICLVGFIASNGVRMPDHINTALSIVVLPLNSAINPFIYTFIMIKEKRQNRMVDFLESETTFMI